MLKTSLRPKLRPADLDITKVAAQPADATPANVADIATEKAQVPRNGPMLLGLFGKEDAPQALIRLPSGQIAQVSRGDRVGRDTVLAIAADGVILKGRGAARRLTMPGG